MHRPCNTMRNRNARLTDAAYWVYFQMKLFYNSTSMTPYQRTILHKHNSQSVILPFHPCVSLAL